MVNCSHCRKEIDREVFCSSSHKVMFHRLTKSKLTVSKSTSESSKEVLTPKVLDNIIKMAKQDISGFCKHKAMIGLCKFNCS
jgi:hypothetical protein